jgi:hypothetical protein
MATAACKATRQLGALLVLTVCLAPGASARTLHHPVVVSVEGPGHVTAPGGQSSPALACPPSCWTTAPFEEGAAYTLTAEPDAGARLVGWYNDCAAAGVEPTCTLSGERSHSVHARFAYVYGLVVTSTGTGTGEVRGARGLVCRGTCTVKVPHGVDVTLTAFPDAGSLFAGWGGACSGTAACAVTVQAATAVAAAFRRDVAAPTVRALSGAGAPGGSIPLRYRVGDDSGSARVELRVLRGPRVLARLTAPLAAVAVSRLASLTWVVPERMRPGALRLCAVASDVAGNRSAASCAPLTLRR